MPHQEKITVRRIVLYGRIVCTAPLGEHPFEEIATHKDPDGNDRIIMARR